MNDNSIKIGDTHKLATGEGEYLEVEIGGKKYNYSWDNNAPIQPLMVQSLLDRELPEDTPENRQIKPVIKSYLLDRIAENILGAEGQLTNYEAEMIMWTFRDGFQAGQKSK